MFCSLAARFDCRTPHVPNLKKKKITALDLSVKVFSTKVVTGDNIFTSPTGDGTAILRGLAEIAVQREYLHFSVILIKTLSIGSATGIEPATSRSAVKRSTD